VTLYSTQVKKSWKLNHIEISAKHNWNIHAVFRLLAKEIVAVKSRAGQGGRDQPSARCCLVCL